MLKKTRYNFEWKSNNTKETRDINKIFTDLAYHQKDKYKRLLPQKFNRFVFSNLL